MIMKISIDITCSYGQCKHYHTFGCLIGAIDMKGDGTEYTFPSDCLVMEERRKRKQEAKK